MGTTKAKLILKLVAIIVLSLFLGNCSVSREAGLKETTAPSQDLSRTSVPVELENMTSTDTSLEESDQAKTISPNGILYNKALSLVGMPALFPQSDQISLTDGYSKYDNRFTQSLDNRFRNQD